MKLIKNINQCRWCLRNASFAMFNFIHQYDFREIQVSNEITAIMFVTEWTDGGPLLSGPFMSSVFLASLMILFY